MTSDKLLKLANKFEDKYLLSRAQAKPDNNMLRVVEGAHALHQLRIYFDYLSRMPNFDPNSPPQAARVPNWGKNVIANFKAYQQAIEENLAPYYNIETRQYTPLYLAQKKLPSDLLAQFKANLQASVLHASDLARVLWYNAEPNSDIRSNVDKFPPIIDNAAKQITLS